MLLRPGFPRDTDALLRERRADSVNVRHAKSEMAEAGIDLTRRLLVPVVCKLDHGVARPRSVSYES